MGREENRRERNVCRKRKTRGTGQEKNGTKRRSDDRTRDCARMTSAMNVAAKVIERKMTIEGGVTMIAERSVAGKMIAGMMSDESKMTADEMIAAGMMIVE